MRKTVIKTIQNKKQVYPTYGDYRIKNGVLNIYISKFEDQDVEFGIAVHEFIESYLILKKGIKIKDIDKFDKEHLDSEDPGCLKEAPYHKEHMFCMEVEKMLCKFMKKNWNKYYNSEPK